MKNYDLLRTGCINLWRRKTRTILTALSMTIGVMCIVVLIAIGIGYGQAYEETVSSMGSLTKIDVTPRAKMRDSQKSALLNDKAVESFKTLDGVEAVTPVQQSTGYLKSGGYVAMVKLYGIDLTTAESFLLTPLLGEAPGEGMRLHPQLMVTDDLGASFADPRHDWADAADENGNPLVDPLTSPVKLTFDYNTLNGTQSADSEGRASSAGTFYNLDITGVCSSLNYTYATSAFLDRERLEEWQEAGEKQAAAVASTAGVSSGGTSAASDSGSAGTSGTGGADASGSGAEGGSGAQENSGASESGQSGTSGNSGSSTQGSGGSGSVQSGSGRAQRANPDTERAAVGSAASSGSTARGGTSDPALKDTYDLVWIKAEDLSDVQRISDLIKDAGFDTYSLNDMLEAVKKQSRQIQGMLGAIGLIAMLVSGICVANTMMMSINERTKEVGILKVLGMEFSDIARMFLTEAFLVGLAGGVAGLLLSFLMGRLIPRIFADMELRCVFPWWLSAGGIAFAGVVALIAAWLPARKAMAISPNEAIRAE